MTRAVGSVGAGAGRGAGTGLGRLRLMMGRLLVSVINLVFLIVALGADAVVGVADVFMIGGRRSGADDQTKRGRSPLLSTR